MKRKPQGSRVKFRSTNAIEAIAQEFKDLCGLGSQTYICPIRLYEQIVNLIPKLGFQISIVEDDELPPNVEAMSYPDSKLMEIKNSVYEAVSDGQTRARFTIAHEIGHLLMHRGTQAFARGAAHTDFREDSEWQADRFAAALLMDSRLITNEMSAADIANKFGVSYAAARIRKENIMKRKRH